MLQYTAASCVATVSHSGPHVRQHYVGSCINDGHKNKFRVHVAS